MKANELRIGNWVLLNGLRTTVNIPLLKAVFEKNIHYTCEPIQLTEEWLIKFGFKNDDGDFVIERGRQGFIVAKAQNDDLILLYREDIGLNYNSLKFIEYVHELQNLFFALTDTELEFKN